MESVSFSKIAIVSCGTLSLELNYLKQTGVLDADHLYFTTPGLHEDIHELERQLIRTMQKIIAEQGPNVARIDATHCMDMIASEAEREEIAREVAGGEKVWWMTPGWVQFRHKVFKGWDKGLANENFPRHTGGAIVLDGIGFMDRYMAEWPEAFLEYADWMGIPMTPYPVTLDRFTSLLADQARRLSSP